MELEAAPTATSKPSILFVASEWNPYKGGISTFNIQLAADCAAEGTCRVYCAVPRASTEELANAAKKGVSLVLPKHPFEDDLLDNPKVAMQSLIGPLAEVYVCPYNNLLLISC